MELAPLIALTTHERRGGGVCGSGPSCKQKHEDATAEKAALSRERRPTQRISLSTLNSGRVKTGQGWPLDQSNERPTEKWRSEN